MPTERWWLFLVPSGLILGLVMLYPLAYAIYLSLLNYDLGSGSRSFIGLANYASLMADQRFWTSLAQTILFAVAAVSLECCLGLIIAYGLYRLTYGRRPLNVLLFVPHIITPVVAGLYLRWIFTGRWGLLNSLLISAGVVPPDWLGAAGWARLMIVLADSWQFTPFMILVLFAGLNTVDQSQIDAAQIDGVGVWGQLFRIMIPTIKPLLVFVLVIRFMDAFRVFDIIYVLTAGGPGTATETITMYTYALAFRLLEIGKASALGVLILIILSGITGLFIAFAYHRDRGAF